jgi:hypothetical protein
MLKLILKYWWTTFGFSAVVFWDKISFGVPLSEIGSVIVVSFFYNDWYHCLQELF